MRSRIFVSMLILVLLTIMLSTLFLFAVYYQQLSKDVEREMNNGVAYVSAGIKAVGYDYLSEIDGLDRNSRITLVDLDGTVLFDNFADVSNMDNHRDREEIAEAMSEGRGQSVRFSKTLDSHYYYLAVRLDDGKVLRISARADSIFTVFMDNIVLIIAIALVAFLILLILARQLTKRIVEPINKIDLENPDESEIYDELSPLITRIRKQRSHIEQQMVELKKKQDEFIAITEGMDEGLIVLDKMGYILSINNRALELVGSSRSDQTGIHFLELIREFQVQKTIESALDGKFLEKSFKIENKIVELRANPVFEGKEVKGAIVLLVDVTEKYRAETIRKEFSANVSHELKTPLTSIYGYAELLKNGLVKEEDVQSFYQRIIDEASRLITLIDDIIKLSQLDERTTDLVKEKLNLYDRAKNIIGTLELMSQEKMITVTLEGGDAWIYGVPRLIDDLIYNLCHNAIKYNRPKGSVNVKLSKKAGRVLLSVKDTGIGIPKEHHDRIFERFYRVDKSHSKETGGTGLGLSIVKHITNYHEGIISLDSDRDKGTEITISFPEA
ncbi:MAG: PAS domain-containing protein [Clostridiales bacterium]|nr:PAS domain-containing protein [Clostridiales bacterium]